MNGLSAFDKMCQSFSEYSGSLYKNEDYYDSNYNDEDEPQNIISNKSSFDVNANIITKKLQNHSNETHQNETNFQNGNKTIHPEISTKPTFYTTKEVGPKSEKAINIKQKRNRSKEKDKGSRKNHKLNRYKSHFFFDSHHKISEMIKQTEYYQKYNKNINEIKIYIYNKQKASENLLLLEKTLKEVLTIDDEENKKIIDEIFYTNDSPSLVRFLGKKVKELMLFYSDKDILIEEEYQIYLRNSYKSLIKKLKDKEKKSESYIKSFQEYANNIEQVYKNMNAHTKKKSK